MTDRTIPADTVRAILSEPSISATDAVKMINDLLPEPALPTLADMTEEKRLTCMWMQCDVKGYSQRYIITNARDYNGDIGVLATDSDIVWAPPNQITPRPDLPRMTWPTSNQ